ncbi:HAMP domain-containing protein [Ferruginibacter sp.]
MAEGDLALPVPERGNDELAELARSFNGMTGRIREMLRSREQLLLDVSHELRSPMTRMRLALEFLDPSKTRDRLASDLAELEAMTSDILETARLDSAHPFCATCVPNTLRNAACIRCVTLW